MAPENSQATGRVVEMQVSGLVGAALDWAVAKVESVFVHIGDPDLGEDLRIFLISGKHLPCVIRYQPSSDWRFGGPLIQKYGCDLNCIAPANCWEANCWDEHSPNPDLHLKEAETPLIAACRAIVAAHMGEVVSVPAELVENKSPE